jgi:hypothetical protein
LVTSTYHSKIRAAFAGSLRNVPIGARPAIRSQIGDAIGASRTLPPGLGRATREAADRAFVSGLHVSALVGIAIMALAIPAAAFYVPSRVTLPDGADVDVVGPL